MGSAMVALTWDGIGSKIFSNLTFFHVLPQFELNKSNLKNFTWLKFEKINYVHI